MVMHCKQADRELSSCPGHSAFCIMLKVLSFTPSPLISSDYILFSHIQHLYKHFGELLEVTNSPSFSASPIYSTSFLQ